METMILYGNFEYGMLCFVWNLYGSVCMDISGSISRV